MNPLLADLFRTYRTTGTPRLERQALDLAAMVRGEHAEAEAAAVRALQGYVRSKREAASANLWSRKQRPPLVVWEKHLPTRSLLTPWPASLTGAGYRPPSMK